MFIWKNMLFWTSWFFYFSVTLTLGRDTPLAIQHGSFSAFWSDRKIRFSVNNFVWFRVDNKWTAHCKISFWCSFTWCKQIFHIFNQWRDIAEKWLFWKTQYFHHFALEHLIYQLKFILMLWIHSIYQYQQFLLSNQCSKTALWKVTGPSLLTGGKFRIFWPKNRFFANNFV